MLYKSLHEVDEKCKPDILTYEKDIVDQASEEIPDITIEEMELALRKTGTEQAGFRSGFGTSDHLQSIKTLIKKTIQYNRPFILAFVDFYKAFDTTELMAVLRTLQECRVPKPIYNIYKML
ncbi:hypothetical protein Trydic_g6470 [Trypoxylus dichotomus]